MSDPNVVMAFHEEYILKGSEIIISNTFANAKRALRDAGREFDFEQLNKKGVQLAIEARENQVLLTLLLWVVFPIELSFWLSLQQKRKFALSKLHLILEFLLIGSLGSVLPETERPVENVRGHCARQTFKVRQIYTLGHKDEP